MERQTITSRIIEEENLLPHIAKTGALLQQSLHETLSHHPAIKAIRGRGLMLGLELSAPCSHLLPIALKEGLLFNVTAENVIRLLPPYILNADEAAQIVARLHKTINQF